MKRKTVWKIISSVLILGICSGLYHQYQSQLALLDKRAAGIWRHHPEIVEVEALQMAGMFSLLVLLSIPIAYMTWQIPQDFIKRHSSI